MFLACFITLFAFGYSEASNLSQSDLKSGQIILIPMKCGLCTLIEGEENTVFAHGGIILLDQGQTWVLEAYTSVQQTEISEFLDRVPLNRSALILETKSKIKSSKLKIVFTTYFEGLNYDENFLWDNKVNDKEPMYCTEFLYKILSHFTHNLPTPKPMHYDYKPDDWARYFAKLVPQVSPPTGLPGLSPGDFERFRGFKVVGSLKIKRNKTSD